MKRERKTIIYHKNSWLDLIDKLKVGESLFGIVKQSAITASVCNGLKNKKISQSTWILLNPVTLEIKKINEIKREE